MRGSAGKGGLVCRRILFLETRLSAAPRQQMDPSRQATGQVV
jgi:hypothetical protein